MALTATTDTDEAALEPEARDEHGHDATHPYRERYLLPLVMPLGVVAVVIAFVVSVSRIFLSAHGHAAVVAGTIITVAILIGAVALSAAPKMRSGMVGLATAGLFVAILVGGWLTVGHAEPEEEASGTLDPKLYSATLGTASSTSQLYTPAALSTTTGLVKITLTNDGGEHTLNFDDGSTQFANLHVTKQGDTSSAVAFFEKAGTYAFYCAIPTHRSAGMEGTITVTGNPQTLESAEAAAEQHSDGGDGETPAP